MIYLFKSESIYHIIEFTLFPFIGKWQQNVNRTLTTNMYLTRNIFLASCKDENGEMILSLLHVKKSYKTCRDLLSFSDGFSYLIMQFFIGTEK